MTQNKKDKIVEHIKDLCERCTENISFDEMDIEFKTVEHSVFKGGFRIGNCIQINDEITLSNKKCNFCFSVSGDADSETITKYALAGYIKEKRHFLSEKKKQEAEGAYKKEHPILGFFKY